jgi:hypothetical protein
MPSDHIVLYVRTHLSLTINMITPRTFDQITQFDVHTPTEDFSDLLHPPILCLLDGELLHGCESGSGVSVRAIESLTLASLALLQRRM